jgi:hypothetical protein
MLNNMNKIENAAKWSKERFDAELEKGYNDMLNGCVTPWNDNTRNSPKPSPKSKMEHQQPMQKNSSKV